MVFSSLEELLEYTKNIVGKTFKELDCKNLFVDNYNQENLYKVLILEFYHYLNESLFKVDFEDFGIDIAIIGYQKTNNQLDVVDDYNLKRINPYDILNDDYSHFFKNKLLIIWYELDKNKGIENSIITCYQLYDFTSDSNILKEDYLLIKNYLSKSNKYSFFNASYLKIDLDDTTNCLFLILKKKYLNIILNNELSFFKNVELFSIEDYIYRKIEKFIGKSQIEIYNNLYNSKLDVVPKNIGKMLSDKMIGTDEEIKNNSFFKNVDCLLKSIPVDENYKPIERMAFRSISLSEFNDNWENSYWKRFFERIILIAICYEGNKNVPNGYRTLKGIKKITFSKQDIESFKITYEMIQNAISNHDISLLPYPNSFDEQYLEVAPKGQKGAEAYNTFFEKDKTQVCFMLNKEFLYDKFETDEENCDVGSFNVFELYNYGISFSIIKILADNRIPPFNIYINGLMALNNANFSLNKKRKVINAVKTMIDSRDNKRNISELYYSGLSKNIVDNLINMNITVDVLKKINMEQAKIKYSINNSTYIKIQNAIRDVDNIIFESNKNINSFLILEKILMQETIDEEMYLPDLKKILNKYRYPLKRFESDYEKLLKEGKIIVSNNKIKYNFINFKDYLNSNYSKQTAEILIRRFEGETLASIGLLNNITRERVRQIVNKLNLKQLHSHFREDCYRNLFQKYRWDKNTFCQLFNEPNITFNYLNERYTMGDNDLIEILNDEFVSDDVKNSFRKIKKVALSYDGGAIINYNDFLKRFLLKYATNEIAVADLVKIYNEEINKFPELSLKKTTTKNFEGKLNRLDYAILGSNHMVRYYNINELSEDDLNELRNLLNIDVGFYSTEYFFRNNYDLMISLNIKNGNELHYILKKIANLIFENVTFLRMPNILIGYTSKNDFLYNKMQEYSPINFSEFIDMLYDNYGHKKNTMISYMISEFSIYIDNGIINVETTILNDEDIKKLKNLFVLDIYSLSEVKRILKTNNYTDINSILTIRNFLKVGYHIKGNYILKNKYSTIYDYLDDKINTDDVIKFDFDVLNIGSVYNAVNNYCKEFKLFRFYKGIYITIKKMRENNLGEEYLEDFINSIKNEFNDWDYFSVFNVCDIIDCDKFKELGFSEDYIEDIISCIKNVKVLRINNNRLFSFTKDNLNKSNFMYDMANKYSSISLDDLECQIYDAYQIEIPFDKLRSYLYNTDIFYSDILGKIYIDKEDYYKEVYDE